jgi:hypothetical protein
MDRVLPVNRLAPIKPVRALLPCLERSPDAAIAEVDLAQTGAGEG